MEQLRFTVEEYHEDRIPLGKLVSEQCNARYCYIHGEAEYMMGFDIADYISGDIMQMRQPIEQQDIVMVLRDGGTVKINAHYSCCSDYFLLILVGDEESLEDDRHSDPYTCTADYCRARYRLVDKPREDKEHAERMRKWIEKDYLTGWSDRKEGD